MPQLRGKADEVSTVTYYLDPSGLPTIDVAFTAAVKYAADGRTGCVEVLMRATSVTEMVDGRAQLSIRPLDDFTL